METIGRFVVYRVLDLQFSPGFSMVKKSLEGSS